MKQPGLLEWPTFHTKEDKKWIKKWKKSEVLKGLLIGGLILTISSLLNWPLRYVGVGVIIAAIIIGIGESIKKKKQE